MTFVKGSTWWDEKVKGLHLREFPSGNRAYYLSYRTKSGIERKPKIGPGDISVTEARRRASILLSRVAIGEDPKGEWDKSKAEKTITELFNHTWDIHWNAVRFTKSGWAKQVRLNFENHIEPAFGGKIKISSVTPKMVRDWHSSMSETPTTANRSLEILSRMFQVAQEEEWIPQGHNPCKLVKSYPEAKRKRFATKEEIEKIGQLLHEESKYHPQAAAFLYLLIYSGSRPRAIEQAQWKHLTTVTHNYKEYGILKLPGKNAAATGEEDEIILPPQVMQLLRRLAPHAQPKTSYICGGIKLPRRMWERIKKEAGCPDLWARDWRRTFATVGLSSGMDISTIGELLNHKSNETTKIYAKLDTNARMVGSTKIANSMEKMLNGEE